MALTQIVLIRHGESLGNVAAAAANAAGLEAIEAGARDPDVALSPAGLEQATALRRGLSLLLSDGVSTAIWSSPYRRAVQTAEVALAAGVARPAIRIDERLRDRELGVLDLLT
ncbi:MAG TPA: phosphoglycerate mutase family protein, partial [Propionicimonas sp.]|nr:phosphoglycerate mutase family protein [Propionicimonas sp.]